MSNTCESCGGKLTYVCPTVQHCEGGENERGPYDGCKAVYIDGIRYVPYEEKKCETCQYERDCVEFGYLCCGWRRKE